MPYRALINFDLKQKKTKKVPPGAYPPLRATLKSPTWDTTGTTAFFGTNTKSANLTKDVVAFLTKLKSFGDHLGAVNIIIQHYDA